MEQIETATANPIQPGYRITYKHPNGGTAIDLVKRIQGTDLIVEYLTIGDEIRERRIPLRNVISYTVYL